MPGSHEAPRVTGVGDVYAPQEKRLKGLRSCVRHARSNGGAARYLLDVLPLHKLLKISDSLSSFFWVDMNGLSTGCLVLYANIYLV